MPFQTTVIISVAAVLIGIGVYAKTKRPGPVLAVALGAFLLVAISDTAFLKAGADLVVRVLKWVGSQFTGS